MQNTKILLVDDDAEDRAIIMDAMEHLQALDIINYAENGEAALRLLETLAEQQNYPCLIVLDLNMPRMNGRQTLMHLKNDARYSDIAVIIYSTSINPVEKEICMAQGAQAYIAKPVSYTESIETAKLFISLCDAKTPA